MPHSPSRPRTGRWAASLAAAAAILATLTGTPANAETTSPVYSGTGWKAATDHGIYSLSPDPYVIVFADATARTVLTPYLTEPAEQATAATGVQVTVSTLIDTTPATSCPARHRIVVHYVYRPLGTAGMSQARPCYQVSDGSAWGGHVLMDSEYWSTQAWFSTNTTTNEAYRRNAVSHELAHILGLDHPNYDKDGDGSVEAYECVTYNSTRPVLCSPNGGYLSEAASGSYLSADLNGLQQMARNWYLRGLS